MPVDLNRVREKLKSQRNVGVSRDGQIQTTDPRNDGSRPDPRGVTTLKPERFF